jgi:hypothetical protein
MNGKQRVSAPPDRQSAPSAAYTLIALAFAGQATMPNRDPDYPTTGLGIRGMST